MNAAKILGIILAALGCIFLFIALLMKYALLIIGDPHTIIYFAIDMFAWVGAIVVKGRRIGGFLVLLVGVIIIIFCGLFASDPIGYAVLAPLSLFPSLLPIPYVTLEALLMIGGGLIIMASGPLE